MSVDTLHTMKQQIVSKVQAALGDIDNVNAHELGEAIDMIKDLEEAEYYCTITQSMKAATENKEQKQVINYYTAPRYDKRYPDYYRDIDRQYGKMYYTPTSSSAYTNDQGISTRDPREGRSPIRRRMYIEGKQLHRDTNSQLRELEAYLQELSSDISEMIKDSSTEEKTVLKQKITALANKIA